MCFKSLCTALALAVGATGAAQAAPVIDTRPIFTYGDATRGYGMIRIPKAKQSFDLDYDFTGATIPNYASWAFELWLRATPEDEAVYGNYWFIDPSRPETLKGRISFDYGQPSYSQGLAYWKITSNNVPGDFRLSLHSAGAVPEPSTWAIMILGFGAIGFAMRRRQVSYQTSSTAPTRV